jgi:peptidyl-prolyl cis-trans isomerase B (cyclophilin B)
MFCRIIFSFAVLVASVFATSAYSQGKELKVRITTNKGVIEGKLFHSEVPRTVSNFVELSRKGFYNGLTFHRVVPNFMIQGGDPKGNGTGGPGYAFADEFVSTLRHSKPGIFSMANSGPDTNGSQFFITVKDTPHLDNRHTVFGEVTSGMDVVNAISTSPITGERPTSEIKMEKVEIIGDWFKPIDFKKQKEVTELEIKNLSKKPVELLLAKIGEAQGFGKMTQVTYTDGMSRGGQAQVRYGATYAKHAGAQLIAILTLKDGAVEVQQFQFIRGSAK